jgi:hypothetical protein
MKRWPLRVFGPNSPPEKVSATSIIHPLSELVGAQYIVAGENSSSRRAGPAGAIGAKRKGHTYSEARSSEMQIDKLTRGSGF